MHNIEIADKRTFFWQWDTGCRLRVKDVEEGGQVHFYRDGMAEPFSVPVYKSGEDMVCDVPDEILQIPKKFAAYTYKIDEFGSKTYTSRTFTVESRPKPANYMYTPTERYDVHQVVNEAIDKIKDGIPSKSIIDVAELPEEDINTSLLYRTAEGVYWYDGVWHKVADESDLDILEADIEEAKSIAKGAHQAVSFGNYETMITALNALPKDTYKIPQSIMIVTLNVPDLWVSSIAEESVAYTYVDDDTLANEIKTNGSVQVGYYVLSALETQKVDLTDYVTRTDYCSQSKAGVMRVNPSGHGMQTDGNGYVYPLYPQPAEIDKRISRRWIDPANLDYCLKVGITGKKTVNNETSYGNQPTLTDEEKASALAWLGAVGKTDYASGANAGVIKVHNHEGLRMINGVLSPFFASGYEINNKAANFVLAPSHIDKVVKVGVTTNTETLTDEEKLAALKWLGALTDTDVAYTCSNYKHSAIVEGYLADFYGFATTDALAVIENRSAYALDVECTDGYGGVYKGTLSLANARGIELTGGFAVSIPASTIFNGAPEARIIVVYDVDTFNHKCSCDLESTGTYLSYTQKDNDAIGVSYTTKVTALRTVQPKVRNDALYLEGHPAIKSLMARIEALEKK